jgi:serine/threonine protein kinase
VKVLPFATMLDARQLERFRNEARIAAILKHPNIVSVYSVGCPGVSVRRIRGSPGGKFKLVRRALEWRRRFHQRGFCHGVSIGRIRSGSASRPDRRSGTLRGNRCHRGHHVFRHTANTLRQSWTTIRVRATPLICACLVSALRTLTQGGDWGIRR